MIIRVIFKFGIGPFIGSVTPGYMISTIETIVKTIPVVAIKKPKNDEKKSKYIIFLENWLIVLKDVCTDDNQCSKHYI